MKIVSHILILSLLFLLFSCKKSDPKEVMPPITSNGAGILGYYLNGNIQYSIDDSNCDRCIKPMAGIDTELSHCDRYYIFMRGFVYPNKEIIFSLNVTGLDTGTYQLTLNDGVCENSSADYDDYNGEGDNYATDLQYGGFIHISHLDANLDFISGTFAFEAKNEANEDIIEITDGRFDIPLTVW